MRTPIKPLIITLFLLGFLLSCSNKEEIIIEKIVTGPVDANCYLVYGAKTKNAALIDVGGPVDSLTEIIKDKELNLKYLLCTHGHFDHVAGLEKIVNDFPEAGYCIHETDYKDMLVQLDWILNKYDENILEAWRANPKAKALFEFSPEKYGTPDVFLEDGMTLKLGTNKIKAIHTPGHSAGGMCFNIDGALFTGDVLMYRHVGNTNSQNSNRDDQIRSVRKLYELFPDNTIVYPGHGKFTDIGSEKTDNPLVSASGGEW